MAKNYNRDGNGIIKHYIQRDGSNHYEVTTGQGRKDFIDQDNDGIPERSIFIGKKRCDGSSREVSTTYYDASGIPTSENR